MDKYNTFRRYWTLENKKEFQKTENFLKKIRWLDNEIDALIENKKSYEELAMKRTSNLICAKMDRLVDYKNEVSDVIEKIDDKECQKILVLKFARYKAMVDIAEIMNMDRSTVYRKYNKAIQSVQEILSDSDKG